MAKADPHPGKQDKKQKKSNTSWAIGVFLATILVSGTISFASDLLMEASGMVVACLILLLIVLLGIIFDVVGVAVASAEERPFHSMAAKKVPGAAEAIRLLRNADRVSSVCNDVVGDICGVVSGAAAATITARVLMNFQGLPEDVISLALSALVAGLTVGGKAIGKSMAIHSCTSIVFTTAKVIHWVRSIFSLGRNKGCQKK